MEFKKEKVYTPLAATPTHNVSQAIKYGNLVFVSGMVGEDENEVLKEGLEAQCEQAFINMLPAPVWRRCCFARSSLPSGRTASSPTRCGIASS